jgi:hypothetical protein
VCHMRRRILVCHMDLGRLRGQRHRYTLTRPQLRFAQKLFFGAVIGISFIVSLVETEIQPKKDSAEKASLWVLEMIFVCAFSGECCHPRCSFLTHKNKHRHALSLSLSLPPPSPPLSLIQTLTTHEAHTVELLINVYGHWMKMFLSSYWCLFDTLVVIVSWISLADPQVPALNFFRSLRVLRV